MTTQGATKASGRRSWRRFLQFRLISLLVVMTLCALLLYAWTVVVRPYQEEQRALKVIENWQERPVEKRPPPASNPFGQMTPGQKMVYTIASRQPGWVDAVWGDKLEFYNRVVELRFNDMPLTDQDLAAVRNFHYLERLYLGGTEVSHRGLQQIRHLGRLEVLVLSGTGIGNEGIKQLRGMPNLQTLTLAGTRITDEGLAYLQSLPNLHELDLGGTGVSDAGIEILADCPNLRKLGLVDTAVRGAPPARLSRLRNLEHLYLGGPRVTDELLAGLDGCPRLRELSVSGTILSRAGYEEHLMKLSGLRQLTLDRVEIESTARVASLPKLPRLTDLTIRSVALVRHDWDAIAGIDSLQRLWLENTSLDDSQLASLKRLGRLSELHLRNTQVSPAAMKDFVESQRLVRGTLDGQPVLAP